MFKKLLKDALHSALGSKRRHGHYSSSDYHKRQHVHYSSSDYHKQQYGHPPQYPNHGQHPNYHHNQHGHTYYRKKWKSHSS
ncbi:hypothetical protein [Paenibacillus flagellatus]|uniref:Uncharacterized protein n=1 Tax=Paenibacillus flagellatus TaxID=2211139 RepID=A0A2V5L3B5_9BACL|nr:hypothetical protein [Paenibacillus flagellatus]PYI57296.1 hypothetical protein DLM86_02320 [Paenibacillus flagellatus]